SGNGLLFRAYSQVQSQTGMNPPLVLNVHVVDGGSGRASSTDCTNSVIPILSAVGNSGVGALIGSIPVDGYVVATALIASVYLVDNFLEAHSTLEIVCSTCVKRLAVIALKEPSGRDVEVVDLRQRHIKIAARLNQVLRNREGQADRRGVVSGLVLVWNAKILVVVPEIAASEAQERRVGQSDVHNARIAVLGQSPT